MLNAHPEPKLCPAFKTFKKQILSRLTYFFKVLAFWKSWGMLWQESKSETYVASTLFTRLRKFTESLKDRNRGKQSSGSQNEVGQLVQREGQKFIDDQGTDFFFSLHLITFKLLTRFWVWSTNISHTVQEILPSREVYAFIETSEDYRFATSSCTILKSIIS